MSMPLSKFIELNEAVYSRAIEKGGHTACYLGHAQAIILGYPAAPHHMQVASDDYMEFAQLAGELSGLGSSVRLNDGVYANTENPAAATAQRLRYLAYEKLRKQHG